MSAQLTTAPLSDTKKEHLDFIYNTRRRTFLTAYSFVLILALLCCFRIDYRDKWGNTHRFTKKDADKLVDRGGMYVINILFLETPLILFGARLYRKRIHSYKKDIENGIKEMVPYTITSKKYFPNTSQYFFSFDDPNYMHYEVDASLYHKCAEGDTLYVSRAPLSKYVFDEKGRFSVI